VTVRSTGVLANDAGVNLVAGFASQPAHGSLVFNSDGTFLYQHNGDTATSDSFTYRVGEGTVTDTSPQATVTITIAQEGGQSQVASGTPASGLESWTIQNETAEGGPSNWSGVQSPVYSQSALTGAIANTMLKPGTDLIQTDGLPNGRIDYTLTFTIKSDGTGAVGIMFRYLNAGNYYRFSMFNGEGGQPAYFRLVKVTTPTGGATTTTVLRETVFPAGQTAYVAGQNYTLTLRADDLPQLLPTDPIRTDLVVKLQDPVSGQFPVDWALTDTQSAQTPLETNGLALYSARNAGSTYNLLSVTGLDNATQRALEVRTSGTGLGTVRGTVADAGAPGGIREVLLTPGALVTSLAPDTRVTLTATPQVAGGFGGWTGPIVPDGLDPLKGTVTLDQAIGLTKVVTAQFTGGSIPALNLDVNADGFATPQDAIVILRYLSLVTGPALTAGVVTGGQRQDPATIKTYLDQAKTTMLDVNQDGFATPQDAIVILRHLSLVSGPALTAGVITGGAQPDYGAIKTFLNRYTPGVSLSSTSTAVSSLTTVTPQSSASASALSAQSLAPADSTLVQDSALPSHSELSTQNLELAESAAVAATQLSSTSVKSPSWVPGFVGMNEEEELLVKL
jgi:hypothetical protein